MGATAANTVKLDVPLFPSLVAVIVAVPAIFPVTTPDELTVATFVADDCHVTVRPVSVLPLASFKVAVSGVVDPIVTLDGSGVTVTVFTGGTVTVMFDVSFFPSLVAVITALPAPTPVTSPVDETVAN